MYVLYDEGRNPIYIGQAGQGGARLFNRLRSHQRDRLAHRWHYFSWFGLLSVNKNGELSGRDNPTKRVTGTIRSTLNEIEGVLIAATEPAFNKQGARFRGIARYGQVAHPDADYVPQKDLRDIVRKLVGKVDELSYNVIMSSRLAHAGMTRRFPWADRFWAFENWPRGVQSRSTET